MEFEESTSFNKKTYEPIGGWDMRTAHQETPGNFKENQLILMHKETEVATTISGNISDDWEIIRPDLLPSSFTRLVSVKQAETDALKKLGYDKDPLSFKTREDMDKWISARDAARDAAREINQNIILSWLAYRVLPFDRVNAKKLHQLLNIPQDNTRSVKAAIALKLQAMSISDNYWMKTTKQNLKWNDIDIKQHPLSEGLAVVALSGKTLTLTAEELTDPLYASAELTTLGSYAKGIFRESDGLYMYKTGDMHTVAAEVVSARILEASNVYGYVDYIYEEKFKLPASKCKLMTTANRDVLHANFMVGNAVSYAQSKFSEQFSQMCVVDYLIGNIDRHGINWGFFREAPTWHITGLHWLYDHNNAFDIDELNERSRAKSVLGQDPRTTRTDIGLEEAARYLYKRSNFKFIKPIQKKHFKMFGKLTDKVLSMFQRRCDNLKIPVIIR